jgi:hypothetical protein
MKAIRRVALFVVPLLVVVLVAGYVWYRTSETAERWRYEDKLATYCAGLIPSEESAVFTGYDAEVGLPHDRRNGWGDEAYHYCEVADLVVQVGRVPAVTDGTLLSEDGILARLGPRSRDHLPVALGGGWDGYTDLHSTGIVLTCTDTPGHVVVDIEGDASHTSVGEARDVAELAAAIGRTAAERWSCDADLGGPVPPLPAPEDKASPFAADGTCQGLPIPKDHLHIDWALETRAVAAAPVERCSLIQDQDDVLYRLDAEYGLFAQATRARRHNEHLRDEPAGVTGGRAWATATCPGAPDALLTISGQQRVHEDEPRFLVDTLRAFAERSVKRHGCTDLRLPSVR